MGSTFLNVLITFFVSMVPLIELRGAIPIGMGLGLPTATAIIVSIIGNLVPVPFIILLIKKIFAWMRRVSPKLEKVVVRMEKKAEKHRHTVENFAFWGLFILVAIPLPGTGAWTGSLVAALMDIPLKKAAPAIALGVLGAGIIVSVISYGAFKIF